ncbi:MAG: UTP--glucose-1-phosphate uridylyltransferase [delta proteobacterium ML8_F1]|nr:MAG: UTP--glucose-1-phosphate uridylyltransferase [delta proteobacterium ML8_F1]
MKIRKAIILAAGLGTRFLPATKSLPKETLPIVDKPTIQYIVEEAVASGITDILIITGRNKRSIEDHFDKSVELEIELEKSNKKDYLDTVRKISNMAKIHYIRQIEPRGLGHAISCARTFVGDEPFAILLGDDIVDSEIPCLSQMISCFNKYESTILGVQPVDKNEVNKYGIISGNKISEDVIRVHEMVEKPEIDQALSNIAVLGRYIVTPRIFEILERVQPGKNGEIQLTDALRELANVEQVYAFHFKGKRYDVGDHLGFLQANIEFALKDRRFKESFSKYLEIYSSIN